MGVVIEICVKYLGVENEPKPLTYIVQVPWQISPLRFQAEPWIIFTY
jgi:hypothetical protein